MYVYVQYIRPREPRKMADSSPKKSKGQVKGRGNRKTKQFNCDICEKTILDKHPGEEAVFCEGSCQSWLHRRCAGLPTKHFKNYCPTLASLSGAISVVRNHFAKNSNNFAPKSQTSKPNCCPQYPNRMISPPPNSRSITRVQYYLT